MGKLLKKFDFSISVTFGCVQWNCFCSLQLPDDESGVSSLSKVSLESVSKASRKRLSIQRVSLSKASLSKRKGASLSTLESCLELRMNFSNICVQVSA